MNYLSVCSGIEAATVAWHPVGWNPAAYSEIDSFPCKVLAHHYPAVPNWGDMTKFKEWPDANINVLVGGTPCQSFSIAGLRKGLDDPRGNLMLTYLAIAAKYRSEWVVWENVPGVLSSNGGKDFGTFLAGLAECGYGFAYRVLDAQYVRTDGHPYAVPQRRRRVFVVGCLGSWQRAAAVLFDSESLCGNPPPSREKGKEVTGPIMARTTGGGGFGGEFETSGGLQAVTCMAHGQGGAEITEGYAPTLNCNHEQPIAFGLPGNWIGRKPENRGNATEPMRDISPNLTSTDRHAVAFSAGNSADSRSIGYSEEHTPPLRAGASGTNQVPTVAFSQNIRDEVREMAVVGALSAHPGMKQTSYIRQAMQVRRLTPLECERLQGFPEVRKSVIIRIINSGGAECSDHQKNCACAAMQNHRQQNAAGSAGKSELQKSALCAAMTFHANSLSHTSQHAEVNALLNLEALTLEIRSQGRLLSCVSLAEKKNSFPQLTPVESIARLLAQLLSESDRKVQLGGGESQVNINRFSRQENGSPLVNLCGREIEELANDAEKFTTKLNECTKSITSEVGQNFQNSEPRLKTLCCSVMSVISTYIPEQIKTASSYEINLEVSHGYTNIPGASDSARYKALGNSMAVNVMQLIGQRIQMVSEIA